MILKMLLLLPLALECWSSTLKKGDTPIQLVGLSPDCRVICVTVWIFNCEPLPSLNQYCKRISYRDKYKCCKRFLPGGSSTTERSPTSTQLTTTKSPIDRLCNTSASNCLTGQTSNQAMQSRLGCEEFCNHPCQCKTHAKGMCEFHVESGNCQARSNKCSDEIFSPNECRRKGAFYGNGGSFCFNTVDRTDNCQVMETILAVNINGGAMVDRRGIMYQSEKHVSSDDPYNARRNFDYSRGLSEQEKYLYGKFAGGHPNGADSRQCLYYTIIVKTSGLYELCARSFEPYFEDPGKRIFGLVLGTSWIAPEIDIFALNGRNKPTDLCFNFELTQAQNDQQIVALKGFNMMLINGTIKLGFCVGECFKCGSGYYSDASYVASAFSVVRLKRSLKT